MKIAVLNGSPKGDKSITKRYVSFIEKTFAEHSYSYINAGNEISRLERNLDYWKECISILRESDLILFAFPLYVYLVPSQMKRFFELISTRNENSALKGKYAATLTTSINFFDHTAHNYTEAVCNDWDMNYIDGISFSMHDLFDEDKRAILSGYAENIFDTVAAGIETIKTNYPLRWSDFTYDPDSRAIENIPDAEEKKILLLSDNREPGSNLEKMCSTLKKTLPGVEEININDLDMKAGCQGCLRCGWSNNCLFESSDGFTDFYNNHILPAQIIIYAGKIQDRYLSSRWKMFFDRRFFNTHKPTLMGKQVGFLIEGPLSQLSNLREILEASVQWEQAGLFGFVTDECADSEVLTNQIVAFAEKGVRYSTRRFVKPSTFLGVAGMKIFRDDIYGGLRFPFMADHKYYKDNGFYDFPTKRKHNKHALSNVMIFICSLFPGFRKMVYEKMMKDKMIEPFDKFLASI